MHGFLGQTANVWHAMLHCMRKAWAEELTYLQRHGAEDGGEAGLADGPKRVGRQHPRGARHRQEGDEEAGAGMKQPQEHARLPEVGGRQAAGAAVYSRVGDVRVRLVL